MKKGMYLFSLVGFLALTGLVETISGFVLWLALPSHAGRRGLESSYWGFTRQTWISIHDWVAIALVVVVIIHLILHWKWVVRMTKQIYVQLAEAYRSLKGASGSSVNS